MSRSARVDVLAALLFFVLFTFGPKRGVFSFLADGGVGWIVARGGR